MRWKKVYPYYGSERTVKKFLIFPKELYSREKGCCEVRWLEQCEIIQEYKLFIHWTDNYWAD
jgi:hypothetical protein